MSKKSIIVSFIVTLLIGISPFIITGTTIYAATTSEATGKEVIDEDTVVARLEKAGYLELNKSDKTVTITEKYKQAVLDKLDPHYEAIFSDNSISIVPKRQLREFTGVNKIVFTWKGYDLYIDSMNANKIAAGTTIGGALSLLIPEPVVSKVVALALATSSGLIQYNNASGRGVIIEFVGALGVSSVPHWIKSQ